MNRTVGALREILTRLYQEQRRKWSPQPMQINISRRTQSLRTELSQFWPSIGERELEDQLRGSDELHIRFSGRKVFYLPPLERDGEFVPVMSMECDIDNDHESLKLRVMLVRRDEDNGKFQGIGFRLESPEGDGGGRHDFYHAQLIKGFRNRPNVHSISWLPDSQPSFPVLARCPVTMILALLITLYGKNYCLEFYTNHSLHQADIKRYMQDMQNWINWPEFS